MHRESNDERPPTPARRRRTSRHDDAVLSAEVRRLVRVLRAYGPLQRASLARISHAERWREGSLDRAVTEAIRDGQARELPFDFLATDQPGAARSSPSRSSEAQAGDRSCARCTTHSSGSQQPPAQW
jgi:hypothetical protein